MAGSLYDVLGVGPDAPLEALRAAHRERARRLHPDVGSGDAAAMRGLNEAWAVLSDPARRAAYDRARYDEPVALPVARHGLRVRLWPFLVLAALLLVVLTAYAGAPGDASTRVEPVGRCLIEGATVDRTEPCRSGPRIVAVGGPGVRCPDRSDAHVLRGDPGRRTACVTRVAGR